MDQALIRRAADGDRAAQEAVVNGSSDLVRGMLYRLVGPTPDLEDLQQTALLHLLVGLKHVREEARLSTWVGSICVNVARDHLRRKRVRSAASRDAATASRGGIPDPTRRLEARDALARCWRVLDRLSPNHRVAFVLRATGYSVDEIAAMMGTARSTTRLRLYWARKAFAKALAHEDGAPAAVLEEETEVG